MAIFRKIHTSFWSDSFISDLDNDKKLFYIYLLTNERTKQCGIYEITKKQMAFDLGYSIDKVSILLKFFSSKNKLRYNDDTKEIALKNWDKFNASTSPKVLACVNKEKKEIKDTLLIEYLYSIDTTSQQEEEQEEEQELKVYSKEVNDCFFNCLVYFDKHLHPKDNNVWIDTIDKLSRIDKIPLNHIVRIVELIRKDDFWSKNFLSIPKLRKKNKDGLMYVIVFNEYLKNKKNGITENASTRIREEYPNL